MWLAVTADLAADLLVGVGERAGTEDCPFPPHHHAVRIGADHAQAAVPSFLQHAAIIRHRLPVVVEQARVEDVVGGVEIDRFTLDFGDHTGTALGPEMKEAAAERRMPWVLAPIEGSHRGVAGGDDAIGAVLGHAEAIELSPHRPMQPGRIRQEQHPDAGLAHPAETIEDARIGPDAVVDAAPKVDQRGVVGRDDFGKAGDNAMRHNWSERGRDVAAGGANP